MAGAQARTEFNQALKAIAQERNLDVDVIMETIRQAYVAAYKRDARERGEDVEEEDYVAEIDNSTGEAKIIHIDPEDPEKKEDVTPPGFGRIAAQTAKQVIHQKIREAEKGAVMDEFEGRVGGLISGTVLRFDGPNVRVDLGKTEGLMPADERIPTERLNSGQRLTFLLKEINDTPRGKQILLSRTDDEFVKKVFAREVPEIASNSVEIKGVAREPGARTKIAVHSTQPGVDPVGSCVGQKGVRVQSVTNELGGERVDIIPWNENKEGFIKATLAPVEIVSIKVNEDDKTAVVTVNEDQLSLAIGKDGQNVRLASRLTGYKIEVQSSGEITPGAVMPERKEETKDETKETDEKTDKAEVKEKTKKDEKKDKDEDKPEEDSEPKEVKKDEDKEENSDSEDKDKTQE